MILEGDEIVLCCLGVVMEGYVGRKRCGGGSKLFLKVNDVGWRGKENSDLLVEGFWSVLVWLIFYYGMMFGVYLNLSGGVDGSCEVVIINNYEDDEGVKKEEEERGRMVVFIEIGRGLGE